jgi:hypothetical protein
LLWFCSLAAAAQTPTDPADGADTTTVVEPAEVAAPAAPTAPLVEPAAPVPARAEPLPKPPLVEADPLAPALDVAAASGGAGTCIGMGVCCITTSCVGYASILSSNPSPSSTTCGTIAILGSLGVCPVASGIAAGGMMSLFSEPGALVVGLSTGVFVAAIPLAFSLVFGGAIFGSLTASRTYTDVATPLFVAGLGITTIGSGVLGAIVGAVVYKAWFLSEPEVAATVTP